MTINSKGEINVKVDVDGIKYSSVEDVIIALRKAAKGLTDARLEIECYEQYGGSVCDVYVEGCRKATPEELKADRDAKKRQHNQRREQEDRQIERLKQTRPEVFKE